MSRLFEEFQKKNTANKNAKVKGPKGSNPNDEIVISIPLKNS